jgi:hypothetical protein
MDLLWAVAAEVHCDFTLLGRGRNPRYTIGSVNGGVAVALQVVKRLCFWRNQKDGK